MLRRPHGLPRPMQVGGLPAGAPASLTIPANNMPLAPTLIWMFSVWFGSSVWMKLSTVMVLIFFQVAPASSER